MANKTRPTDVRCAGEILAVASFKRDPGAAQRCSGGMRRSSSRVMTANRPLEVDQDAIVATSDCVRDIAAAPVRINDRGPQCEAESSI